MSEFNRKELIDEIVLKAKIGSFEGIQTLKEMYGFIFEQVSFSFFNIYDFLKYNRGFLYQKFMEALIETVNEYEFQKDCSFGGMLKERTFLKIQKILSECYSVPEKTIVKKKTIYYTIKKVGKINLKRRKDCVLAVKFLSPKMKFMCFLLEYKRLKDYANLFCSSGNAEYASSLCTKYRDRLKSLFVETRVGPKTVVREMDIIHRIVEVPNTREKQSEFLFAEKILENGY